jgi:hypothetical protein
MPARLRAWIGIVALLFYSALPIAHHARATTVPTGVGAGVIVYELCTPDGLRVVQIPPAGTDGKDKPSHRPCSCPICQALQHAQAALPSSLAPLVAPGVAADTAPPIAIETAPRRLVIAVPQSRAPPAIA